MENEKRQPIMYQDYLTDIIKYYRAGESNGDIPQRLIRPTPGSIKDECQSVCEVRFQKNDLRTLTAFFKAGNDQEAILRAIHRCDRDRFKPLVNFLKGTTNNTDDLNIELLAWLIDFPRRPFKAEEYAEFSDETKSALVLQKTDVESAEENVRTDNIAIGVHIIESDLTKDQKDKDGIEKRTRFVITRQKMIFAIVGVLLLVFVGIYLADKDMFPVTLGNKTVKTNDSTSGNHDKPGTSVTYQGKKLPIEKNHTTTPDLTIKKGFLLRQQAQESNLQEPNIIKKQESDFPVVDFSSFTNPEGNTDIALLIVDDNRKSVTSLASAVANLYRNKSYTVSTGVFTYAFIHSKYMNEVAGGDISVFSKLVFPSALKYIVIGKYTCITDSGRNTRFVCRAGLDVTVVSVQQKMQVDGFELTAANGYDDEEHARAGAIEKLVDQYQIKSRVIKLN